MCKGYKLGASVAMSAPEPTAADSIGQSHVTHLLSPHVQVRHSNVGDSYTEIVVPRPGDEDIPTTTTVSKPLYGKIRWAYVHFSNELLSHIRHACRGTSM